MTGALQEAPGLRSAEEVALPPLLSTHCRCRQGEGLLAQALRDEAAAVQGFFTAVLTQVCSTARADNRCCCC